MAKAREFRMRVGTFKPKRTDDLKPGVVEFIGKSTTWITGWIIEAEDSEQYAGQMTWLPRGEGWTFGWAPECDIEWEDLKE